MRVRLLIDHSIATDADGFAAQWNADSTALEVGVASVENRSPVLQGPPWDAVTILLVNVGLSITANLLTDVVKLLIEKVRRRSPADAKLTPVRAEALDLEVTESVHSDGTREFKLRLRQTR